MTAASKLQIHDTMTYTNKNAGINISNSYYVTADFKTMSNIVTSLKRMIRTKIIAVYRERETYTHPMIVLFQHCTAAVVT